MNNFARRRARGLLGPKFLQEKLAHFNEERTKDKSSKSRDTFGGAGTWISGITLFITIITVTLYAAGKAYRSAYLDQFDVIDALIPWAPQDLIYFGALTQLSVLLLAPLVIIGLIFAIVAFMWTGHILGTILEDKLARLKSRPIASKGLIRPSRKSQGGPHTETEFLILLSLNILVLFIIIFSSTAYVGRAEQLGSEDGRTDRLAILNDDLNEIRKKKLMSVEIQNQLQKNSEFEKGYLFSCSDKACFLSEKGYMLNIQTGKDYARIVTRYVTTEQLREYRISSAI